MLKITLYVGLNDKEKRMQLIGTLDAYRIVNNILGVDSTITECKGVYTHADKKVTTENTLQVVLLDFDNNLNRDWLVDKVGQIKQALNQESVAAQFDNVDSELL